MGPGGSRGLQSRCGASRRLRCVRFAHVSARLRFSIKVSAGIAESPEAEMAPLRPMRHGGRAKSDENNPKIFPYLLSLSIEIAIVYYYNRDYETIACNREIAREGSRQSVVNERRDVGYG